MLPSRMLSISTKALMSASLLVSATAYSTAASAAACQAGPGGCVLPVPEAAPAALPEAAGAGEIAAEAGGLGWQWILLGALALLGGALLAFGGDEDNNEEQVSP